MKQTIFILVLLSHTFVAAAGEKISETCQLKKPLPGRSIVELRYDCHALSKQQLNWLKNTKVYDFQIEAQQATVELFATDEQVEDFQNTSNFKVEDETSALSDAERHKRILQQGEYADDDFEVPFSLLSSQDFEVECAFSSNTDQLSSLTDSYRLVNVINSSVCKVRMYVDFF